MSVMTKPLAAVGSGINTVTEHLDPHVLEKLDPRPLVDLVDKVDPVQSCRNSTLARRRRPRSTGLGGRCSYWPRSRSVVSRSVPAQPSLASSWCLRLHASATRTRPSRTSWPTAQRCTAPRRVCSGALSRGGPSRVGGAVARARQPFGMRFGAVILPDRTLVGGPRRDGGGPRRSASTTHGPTTTSPGARCVTAPWFGAIPTLTAAATVTSSIRLGPLVASANFRHPVTFAKELMTLDDVSGGRLTVGVGAGGEGWDATMLGDAAWSAAERTDRFIEFVTLTDQLLRAPATTFDGRFYSTHEVRSVPGCIQQPRAPFVIAATGPRGMHVAAEHAQAWVTTGDRRSAGPVGAADGAAMVRGMVERLHDACRSRRARSGNDRRHGAHRSAALALLRLARNLRRRRHAVRVGRCHRSRGALAAARRSVRRVDRAVRGRGRRRGRRRVAH